MKEEIWKDIEGYEGLYQVSDLGRIRNFQNKIMKQHKNHKGYLIIQLSKEGRRKTLIVHSMNNADEMFEELGYRIMFDNTCMFRYVKCFDLKPKRHIIFAVDKTISVCEENENELAINRDYFTMQELKAINKKCEELGWI